MTLTVIWSGERKAKRVNGVMEGDKELTAMGSIEDVKNASNLTPVDAHLTVRPSKGVVSLTPVTRWEFRQENLLVGLSH